MSDLFRRLTLTHTMRWHAHDQTGGTGHLDQGRFKPPAVQDDYRLLTVERKRFQESLIRGTFLATNSTNAKTST
ncbi:MAG: hypothetical protein O3A00_19130 [Planctomycetota bacterium]|nr:hypothetical protein [Planctomycetota bacterium]